jgi:hypothetical protein
MGKGGIGLALQGIAKRYNGGFSGEAQRTVLKGCL